MSAAFSTRCWQRDDEPFLWEMLYHSIHVRDGQAPPPRSILEAPDIAHYLSGFGREGDDAEVALTRAGERIGAAWCRVMPADDPGYGFVAEGIPELGMAVVPDWRGRGVGTMLLDEILARHPVMSLSVDTDNSGAERLYSLLGFMPVAVRGTATTMLREPPITETEQR